MAAVASAEEDLTAAAVVTMLCRCPREADGHLRPAERADSVVSTGTASTGMASTGMVAIGIIITITMTLTMSSLLVASPSGVGAGVGTIHIMATTHPTAITHTVTVTMAAVITVPGMAATDTVFDQELLECSDSWLVPDIIMVPSTESWALGLAGHCTPTSVIIMERAATVKLNIWSPIRNRPDFQQLLSGLEQIGPNK